MVGNILGNYRITEELAYSNTGMVYRGQHIQLPREVVIKEIVMSIYPDATRVQLKARYRHDVFIQSQLEHPGIVRLYESFGKSENYYIVSEYVPGINLRELLESQGLPTPGQALFLCKQALLALDYAHSFQYLSESDVPHTGIIHRDLKPANLFIDQRGKLKIADFGIVRLPDRQSMAPPSFRPGTAEYMPPEQLRGLDLDARSDIYSLGVTFYQLLTGQFPFSKPPKNGNGNKNDPATFFDLTPTLMTVFRADIPPALAAVFSRAIHRNPSERFQTAAEFLTAIKEFEQNNGAAEVQTRTVTAEAAKASPEEVTIVDLDADLDLDLDLAVEEAEEEFVAPPPRARSSSTPPPTAPGSYEEIDLSDRKRPGATAASTNGTARDERREDRDRRVAARASNASSPPARRPAASEVMLQSYYPPSEEGSSNLFKSWDSKPADSRKLWAVAATVLVLFGVVSGVYLLSQSRSTAEKSSAQPAPNLRAATTSTPVPTPTIAPEATPVDIPVTTTSNPGNPGNSDVATAGNLAPPENGESKAEVRSGDLRVLQKARKSDSQGRFRQAVNYYHDYLDSSPTAADAGVVSEQLDKLKTF
ncbi:MAG TPA: serine/threonine-protein kinase, partial [Blastocatellia bacterium]|nr:serine/threonine-protein kinase [Blastocatellia bacterium]